MELYHELYMELYVQYSSVYTATVNSYLFRSYRVLLGVFKYFLLLTNLAVHAHVYTAVEFMKHDQELTKIYRYEYCARTRTRDTVLNFSSNQYVNMIESLCKHEQDMEQELMNMIESL